MKDNESQDPSRTCKQCSKPLKKRQKYFCSWPCAWKEKSETYKGRKVSEDVLKKLCGRKLSQQTIEKQNLSKIREKIRIEGEYSCIKCDKKFKANTSLRAHKASCNFSDSKKVATICETCGKIFDNAKSAKMHSSIKHVSSEKYLERNRKLSAARSNHSFRLDSVAEIKFFEDIKGIFHDAVRSYQIIGSGHVYDIFIPSEMILIEFDGDYWHGNPKKYSLSQRMKQQYCIDKTHTEFACKADYGIVRVWQSESREFISSLKEDKTCLRSRLSK